MTCYCQEGGNHSEDRNQPNAQEHYTIAECQWVDVVQCGLLVTRVLVVYYTIRVVAITMSAIHLHIPLLFLFQNITTSNPLLPVLNYSP